MASIPIIVQSGSHGLDPAAVHYKKFPWEPSPAGDLDLEGSTIVQIPNLTFDGLLAELAKAPAGGTVLIICHAHNEFGSVLQSSGLLMPLAADSSMSAQDEAFEMLLDSLAATRKANVIRAMPSATDRDKKAKSDEWIGLATNTALGFPPDGATLPQLERFFEKGLDDLARNQLRLSGGAASLKRLLGRIEKVQGLGLDRVEFRACNIGKDTTTLGRLKQVLGCRKLLAPAARTFYISNLPVETLDRFNLQFFADHREASFRQPGPAGKSTKDPGDVYIDVIRNHPKTRLFWDVQYGQPAPNYSTIKLKDRVFAMIVEEVSPSLYRASAATWHETGKSKPAWDDASKFVHQYIMEQGKYGSGNMAICGFWTPDADLPWLLPNEPDYVDLVKQV